LKITFKPIIRFKTILIALLRYRILNLLRRFFFHLYSGICFWVFALLTSEFVIRGLAQLMHMDCINTYNKSMKIVTNL